jgi:hypothetical protein
MCAAGGWDDTRSGHTRPAAILGRLQPVRRGQLAAGGQPRESSWDLVNKSLEESETPVDVGCV